MSTKSGSLCIVCVQFGERTVSVIRSSGCPLFRGFQCIEVYGETVGTFRIVPDIVGVCC